MTYRILIVDDSFLMRSTLKRIIHEDSRVESVDEAENGKEALELLKEKEYDLVLLDIEMPVMDGLEFMRRSKLHSDSHIVIISSLARLDSPQVDKAVSLGAFDVVAKPTGVLTPGLERMKHDEILGILSRSFELGAGSSGATLQ